MVGSSTVSGSKTSEKSYTSKGKFGDIEARCVQRKLLLESLSNELPNGTIMYSSKVVSIEESNLFKLLHLADGTVIKTMVLIGCDGVNSVVAKWLGFQKAADTGRYAIRGCANFENGHGFEHLFMQFFGHGVRSGVIPCDNNFVYWFLTWTPSDQEKELEENPIKLRQYVMNKLGMVPDQIRTVIENSNLDAFLSSALRYRHPWELLWGNISKGNVCVAGDALHPMTPDLGQGGCSALEDGVVLARCLGEALLKKPGSQKVKEQYDNIEMGLKKYANLRRWRSFELISSAYIVGFIQESDGLVMNFLRDKLLAPMLSAKYIKISDFDCGKLSIS